MNGDRGVCAVNGTHAFPEKMHNVFLVQVE